MRLHIKGLLLAAVLTGPFHPLAAQNLKTYQPQSVWALDYGDDYCRLMRDFSNGDDTLGLFIERTEPGPVVRLIVIGDGVKLYRGAQELGYRMAPLGAARTAPRTVATTATGQQFLNLGPTTFADMPSVAPGAPPPMPAPHTREAEKLAAQAVTGLVIDKGVTGPVHIETGELGSAAQALQTCADDLLSVWGLDADKHRSLSRPAMPAKATSGWIDAGTIAFSDFAKLSGGNNGFRIMVNAQGKPTSCHVHWPSLAAKVNEKICSSVLEKGAFQPALDQAGNAIASYWTTSAFLLLPLPG